MLAFFTNKNRISPFSPETFIPHFLFMKKIILAGFISIMSIPLISFATESQTPRQFSASEITYIKNINCDTFTGNSKTYCLSIKTQAAAQSGNTGTTLPENPNTPVYQTGSGNPPPS